MIPLLFWLSGCVVEATTGDPIDCEALAIRGADGTPDACDVDACRSCVATCGRDCTVLESYPPVWSCPDSSTDVYDFCEDWQPPGTPRITDVEDLGCGSGGDLESLAATAPTAGRIAVTHLNYATGCCPEQVLVTIEASGSTLSVSYEPVNDLCDCACMLDVRYAIADVPSGSWTITHPDTGASATVIVP